MPLSSSTLIFRVFPPQILKWFSYGNTLLFSTAEHLAIMSILDTLIVEWQMLAWHEMLSRRQLFNTLISAKLLSEELINSLLKPQRFTLVASVPLGLRACLHNHSYKCEILHDCYWVFLELFSESSWKHNSCISDFNLNRFMMYDPFFIIMNVH